MCWAEEIHYIAIISVVSPVEVKGWWGWHWSGPVWSVLYRVYWLQISILIELAD